MENLLHSPRSELKPLKNAAPPDESLKGELSGQEVSSEIKQGLGRSVNMMCLCCKVCLGCPLSESALAVQVELLIFIRTSPRYKR